MSVDFRSKITHGGAVFFVSTATPDSDLEEIADLVNNAYAKVDFVQQRTTVERLRAIVTHPVQKLYLCHSPEKTVCATLQLESVADNTATVALFSVDSSYKGLGTVFLNYIEKELFKTVQEVALNVITFQQERLMTFYQRLGYVMSGSARELVLTDEIRKFFLKPQYRDQILHVQPMYKNKSLGTPV